MMKEELGVEWTRPELFRFGASSLLGDIERQLEHFATGVAEQEQSDFRSLYRRRICFRNRSLRNNKSGHWKVFGKCEPSFIGRCR